MEWIFSTEIWMSLLTLSLLEIILGIDNVIFLSIISSKLPAEKQKKARFIGLTLALLMRVIMLCMIAWIVSLKATIFTLGAHEVSWRDIILAVGGLFLLYKGTHEIHNSVEGDDDEHGSVKKTASFASVIMQIVIIDLVFSLDSVITAVGMTENLYVMIASVTIAIILMMVASEPTSAFVQKHPTVKMLALSFLILVGVALLADAAHFHIPRGYLYFAMAFSLGVESLNLIAAKNRKKKKLKKS